MKKILLFMFLSVLSASIWGQNEPMTLPYLATPSPKASMINRFGEYPTNLYTGLVDITIPIHTIQIQDITIPIEFKYHASGLKYDDLPMEVGYGWTLIAGGTVSYSARGAGMNPPSGTNKGVFIKPTSEIKKNSWDLPQSSDQEYLKWAINGTKDPYQHVGSYCDTEYDVYNLSFPGYSGQYYELSNSRFFSNPATIWFSSGGYPQARDEKGNTYEFYVNDQDGCERNFTFYLTKIISANKSDTINFVYRRVTQLSNETVNRPIIDKTFITNETMRYGIGLPDIQTTGGGTYNITEKKFNTPILTEINYNGGKVLFQYASTSTRSLETIDVRDYGGATIKKVTLDKTNHKYLNAVNFKGINSKHLYAYTFEYNGTKPEGNTGIDYWGYYNGKPLATIHSYVPDFTIPRYGHSNGYKIAGMDRGASEFHMSRGILEKITYPTKGYSIFTYEAHRANGQLYGGLRIKEIKNYDENGGLQERKWYKYGDGETGNGWAKRSINYTDFEVKSFRVESIYSSVSYGPVMPGDRIYTSTIGSFPICSYFTLGSSVVYPYVTEYTGSATGANGKTIYQYTYFEDDMWDRSIRGNPQEFPKKSNAWKCGKLYSKRVYDSSGKMVYLLNNDYEEINREDILNLKVSPYASIYGIDWSNIQDAFGFYQGFPEVLGGSLYDYYNYYITRGEYALKKSQESVNTIAKTTEYKYNELGQVIEQTLIDADNNKLATHYKYPYDLKDTPSFNDVNRKMYDKNILSPVLEKEVYKGTTLLDKVVNEYRQWGNLFAPAYIKQLVGTNLEYRLTYSYDYYGNPREISKDDLENVVYLWSCKGKFPIAEIRNATYSQISNILGQTYLENLTKAQRPLSTDMSLIEGLRNNTTLSASQITTFYYNSFLTGVSYIIAPNGTKIYYEYDDFGRLSRTKDHNGKITNEYQYQYK